MYQVQYTVVRTLLDSEEVAGFRVANFFCVEHTAANSARD